MSFDICVFHSSAAPHQPIEFEKWYRQITEWDIYQEYDDVSVCQSDLQEWYKSMIRRFPVMNGRDQESSAQAFLAAHPEANGDEAEMLLENSMADYSLSQNLIYAAFNWDLASEVYMMARDEAFRLGLGFFDLSNNRVYFSSSDIMLMPDEYGNIPEPVAPLVDSTTEQVSGDISELRQQMRVDMYRDLYEKSERSQDDLNEIEKKAFTDKNAMFGLMCFILWFICFLCFLVFQKVFDFNKWGDILGFVFLLCIFMLIVRLFVRSVVASTHLKHRTGCFFRRK